jgi:hypothetical protein
LQPGIVTDLDEVGREGVVWIVGRFALFVAVPFRSITNPSEWSCVHCNGDERNYDVTMTFVLM